MFSAVLNKRLTKFSNEFELIPDTQAGQREQIRDKFSPCFTPISH
jgi:hypothetical protein